MSEIIVKYNDGNDHMAVRGGEYVQDLVRCKDCRWYKDFDGCFFSTDGVDEDDFCSYGERRE